MTAVTWHAVATSEVIAKRAQLLKSIRAFFDQQGFLEVETPLLSRDTVIDRHLDPLQVAIPQDPSNPSQGEPFYLQTSPEFCMKRLIASGETAIYQICKAFRAAESGNLHNPEFTMLEWYRTGDDMQQAMHFLSLLIQHLLKTDSVKVTSYREAFLKALQIDPWLISSDELFVLTESLGISIPESINDQDFDALLDLLMVERVQPMLGKDKPEILYHYPSSQAALAQVITNQQGHEVAERFELYVQGIELANGYHELLDAAVLIDRNQKNNQLREQDNKPALPETSRLLQAMEAGLPTCAGVALGVDRLLMILCEEQLIDQILCFPHERA